MGEGEHEARKTRKKRAEPFQRAPLFETSGANPWRCPQESENWLKWLASTDDGVLALNRLRRLTSKGDSSYVR